MSRKEINIEAVAEAVCTVARSRAPLFEHEPSGPLSAGIREASPLGFLKPAGNGVVERTVIGSALATSKDPVAYALDC